MKHLFKLPLVESDMFVENITNEEITYSIRNKETGLLMEPVHTSKYEVNKEENKIYFDNRFIDIPYALKIFHVFASE